VCHPIVQPGAAARLLDLPAWLRPELLVTVGHPAMDPPPPPRQRSVVFWERYTGADAAGSGGDGS